MLNNTFSAAIDSLTADQRAALAALIMGDKQAPAKQGKRAKQAEVWTVPEKSYNAEHDGTNLTFDGKPVPAIRSYVKGAGFRWNGKEWYQRFSESAEQAAADCINTIRKACKEPDVDKRYTILGYGPDGKALSRAAAPVAEPVPVKADPVPAAPAKKDPVLHVGLTFTAVTNDGHELTYTATDYPDGGKVKVKDPDGKPAGAFELRKTDAGRLYIVVHKRPAILNK